MNTFVLKFGWNVFVISMLGEHITHDDAIDI